MFCTPAPGGCGCKTRLQSTWGLWVQNTSQGTIAGGMLKKGGGTLLSILFMFILFSLTFCPNVFVGAVDLQIRTQVGK